MKRIVRLLLIILCCVALTSCGSNKHIGEAKNPSGSSIMKGQNYNAVADDFKKNGFTNIKFEKIEDLITGWLTKEGEVEKVSVGGDENYSPDKWVAADTEVIIFYHAFPQTESDNTKDGSSGSNNAVVDSQSTNIKMPYSSADYCGKDWTLDKLTEHLKGLGFTNIEATACDPDEDNFSSNIFEIYIATGMFSDDPWETGDEFPSDAKISIYYNEYPLLTTENCDDLVTVLTSKNLDYMTFANKYDGRYVEFNAYVVENISYMGNTEFIINVAGGDYSSASVPGLIIRVGHISFDNEVNRDIEANTNCIVIGKIDASQSQYFKMLYVEGQSLKPR